MYGVLYMYLEDVFSIHGIVMFVFKTNYIGCLKVNDEVTNRKLYNK